MRSYSQQEVAEGLPYDNLIASLRAAFAEEVEAPPRHIHETGRATLMLMPAWSKAWSGLKVLTLKPDNPDQGLPFIQGKYLLIDNSSGVIVASLDGTELTRRRTAAASALAASYLAPWDARTHLIVGAGALAPHFVMAHRAVRPITRTLIYNRNLKRAQDLATDLRRLGLAVEVVADLENAVPTADIISCLTSSTVALVKGDWLKPGVHLDLAGAYRADMREVDGKAVVRATVFVDSYEGAAHEAGDLLQAEAEGLFDPAHIAGDLAGLCKGLIQGREEPGQITLFKSCGTAIEDLAAAIALHLRCR